MAGNFVNAGIITYPDVEINGDSSERRAGVGFWSHIEEEYGSAGYEPTAIQSHLGDIEQERIRLKELPQEDFVNLIWEQSTQKSRRLLKSTDENIRQFIAASNRDLAGGFIPFGDEYTDNDEEPDYIRDEEADEEIWLVSIKRYSLFPGSNEHRRQGAQDILEKSSPWAFGKCGPNPEFTSAADIERTINRFAESNEKKLRFPRNHPHSIKYYAYAYGNVLHLDGIEKHVRIDGYRLQTEVIIFKDANDPEIAELLRLGQSSWGPQWTEENRLTDDYRKDGQWGSRTPSPEQTSGW